MDHVTALGRIDSHQGVLHKPSELRRWYHNFAVVRARVVGRPSVRLLRYRKLPSDEY
jgi:hypothetical protein